MIIDLFSKDTEAQIIHIKNDGISASAKTVETHLDRNGILDDLDFRASDLLQSNGIVWVEGPSDRTYFNRWVELFTDGTIKEGVHYQCLLYGGKLLAHLTASEEELDEAISVLKVNRNCILIMDSDKKAPQSRINKTKKRIEKEIEDIKGIPWITKGKEVENYLPEESLRQLFGIDTLPDIGPYQSFPEYLEKNLSLEEKKKFSRDKVLFSERIKPCLTKESLMARLDLNKKMKEVINRVTEWNKLPPFQ